MNIHVGNVNYAITETDIDKKCDASDGSYHYWFDKRTGDFKLWGHTEDEDPQWCPAGPEILDLEVCVNGCPNRCPQCYKNNTDAPPTNMTFDTFKTIFHKFNKVLTQIAFGITGLQTNKDFFRMMEYARENGVIPNFTLSGIDLTEPLADRVAALCGAVAVSVYQTDKNVAYNAVKMLVDRGMTQCNIHLFSAEEVFPFMGEVIRDIQKDPRLENMGSVVFLGMKPKGRAKGRYTPLSQNKFYRLVEYCIKMGVPFGFDSCSQQKFEKSVCNLPIDDLYKKQMIIMSEPCESFGMFSSYVNCNGVYFPCSFCEGEGEWKDGIDVLNATDFIKDVWNHPLVNKYRKMMIESGRRCPMYEL